MRKLVLILLAFIAVVTFIRAFDNPGGLFSEPLNTGGASELSSRVLDTAGN
jgi:hypothetical protein